MITTNEPELSELSQTEQSLTVARVAQRSEAALRETSRKIVQLETDISTENERKQAVLAKRAERAFALQQAQEACKEASARANSAVNYAKFAQGTPGAKAAEATAREHEKASASLARNLERLTEQDREASAKEGRQLDEIDARLADAASSLGTLRNQEMEIKAVHSKALADLGNARLVAIEAEAKGRLKLVQAAKQEALARESAFEQWLMAACEQLSEWPGLREQVYATHSIAFHDPFTGLLDALISFLGQLTDGATAGRIIEVERVAESAGLPYFNLTDLLVVEYTPLAQTLAGKISPHLVEKKEQLLRLRTAYRGAKTQGPTASD